MMDEPRARRRLSSSRTRMPRLATTRPTTTILSAGISGYGTLLLLVLLSSSTATINGARTAFTPPQRNTKRLQQRIRPSDRRRRTSNNNSNYKDNNTPFFAVERRLPPLSPTTKKRWASSSTTTKPVRYGTNQGGSANETTLTIPYSSPSISTMDDDIINKYNMLEYDDNDDKSVGDGPLPLPVLYTNCPKQLNRWLVEHVPMEPCAIGFDTESVPDVPWINNNPLKGCPVTVQLATSKASIVVPLIQNNRYSKACLPLLEAVLSDENIVKCGCGLDDDVLDLRRMVPGWKYLEVRSRCDLGLLGLSKDRLGLKALTKIVLKQNLKKPKRIALSDWSRPQLGDEQLAYAARDAWAGAAVLEELARQDPDTFSAETLIARLRSQPLLRELDQGVSQRKKAKQLLKQFRNVYHGADEMPAKVQKKIYKLRAIVNSKHVDNAMESLAFIDVGGK